MGRDQKIPWARFTNPQWVTTALLQSGLLESGRVEWVSWRRWRALVFQDTKVASLRLRYSKGSVGDLPASVVLKIARRQKEHFFYTIIAQAMLNPPVVRCYHAEYNSRNDLS